MKRFIALLIPLMGALGAIPARADALADDPAVKVKPVVPMKAHAFNLQDVRLLDGPFKHAQELDKAYLLSLDPDRLLHTFRLNAGLPSTAQPLGGWEEPKCELRGHFVGHYLSACALMYASTGDERLKQRAAQVVAGLAECQAKLPSGYLSAYPESFIDRVEARQRVWAPYYTLHKIYAGLEDVYTYCGNTQALQVCRKFGDWAIARNARLTDEQMQAMLGNEHGGMNEALANLYGLTGDAKYLQIARRFNHLAVLEPASKGEDKLTGLHANTQIPKFVGTAREYELTGEEWLKSASLFFWNTVVKERSYVIGGHSDSEGFSPKERLSQALGPNTTETCNTYNMLKLTRHLFCWDPQVEYADYYERALYNHILASQNPETGMMCYYVPLRSGSRKNYNDPLGSFWCCTGTGVENHAKYGDSIYFHDGGNGLFVNLFIASELDWRTKGVRIRQETKYPDQPGTRLTLICRQPVELSLSIRRPWWAAAGMTIRVNGKPQAPAGTPGRYAVIQRVWHSGDRVEVSMPFTLRAEGFRDNPDRFAFLYGPLVLSAEVDPRKPFPVVVGEEAKLLAALKPVAGRPNTFTGPASAFRVPGAAEGRGVTLEPFYKMHGERHYVVYWDRLSAEQWQAKEKAVAAEQARQKAWEARTVDQVVPGFDQNERDHKLQGENHNSGPFMDRAYRHGGGWFSWELKVLPDSPQELCVTYWGSDSGGRDFDVLVDGEKLATERLSGEKPGEFLDRVYLLPAKLTQGKNHVTVRFQAHPGNLAGGVFGARILKAEYPIQSVPFTGVTLAPGFWATRLETNRTATIPHAFQQCEQTGRIENFVRAGRPEKGKFQGYFFNDSDVYKVIEGAAETLATHPDPKLDAYLDDLIAKIAAAQEPDGYLYTARTLCGPDYMPPGGKERWSDMAGGHELYCAGHLYEAAAAHFLATGKRALLNVAIKNADLVCSVFNVNGKRSPCGHPEVELALVKLWRVTGDEKYLRQAKFFLDEHGQAHGRNLYGTYSQDHKPLVEQEEAVGHSVRAAYLYSGMTDVAGLLGDRGYAGALDRLWADVVGKKLYLTGGIGAAGGYEGFGEPYHLPNRVAYSETCAGIANALWNYRLFLLNGDARYLDVFERVLYNGVISGVSLDGKGFFYTNPLESDGGHARSSWFGCACCPPNIARFLPQVPGFAYAHQADRLYVNLFLAGRAQVPLASQSIALAQETRYPWDGRVKLTIEPERAGTFSLLLRVPGWARDEAVPSDLYRFETPLQQKVGLTVNGKAVPLLLDKGYAAIRRAWRQGDVVEMVLPMPVRRVLADERVEDDRGAVALQRGPLVYCVEAPDVKAGQVANLLLEDGAPLAAEFQAGLLGGVTVVKGDAQSLRWAKGRKSIEREKVPFTAIPYYAWAHRGPGEMCVWLARTDAGARPLPSPTLASTSKATASGGDVKALNDQREPRSSADHANRFLHWWPHKGTKEWVQYDFAKRARVSAVEVYWFDDTGIGECRLPKSWQLFYRENGEWKPVRNPSGYRCEGNRYNRASFDPVETDALRLEVQMQERWAGGIHEWRVEGEE